MPASSPPASPNLAAYLPRTVVDWQATEPGARHRSISGTLLAADISGFTALSERLASLGRRGAEEVVGVVNRCFDPMIAAVHDHGGDVLLFGGDALFVAFEGRGDAARAAATALAMQAVLAVPVDSATAGPVDLGMSIGLHLGDAHLFLVPGGHRALVVTGPDVSETLRLEGRAQRGQVLTDLATAAHLPPDATRAEDDQLVLVARPPTEARPLPPGPPGVDGLDDLLPRAYRDEVLRGHHGGEIRPVTSAFVSVTGIDVLLAEGGTRRVRRRLDELGEVVGQACEQYGVHWLDTDAAVGGVKVHLAAGAPTSTGDDEGAMLVAARTIVDALPTLAVAAGVARGTVFMGHVGSRHRRTLAAMGDSVNLAARLAAKARPGQVLTTRDVVEAARPRLRVEPGGTFDLKGKAAAVVTVAVLDVGTPPSDGQEGPPEVPLVGRTRELEELRERFAHARRGIVQVIDVLATDGFGKTRLAREATSMTAARVHIATCEPHHESTPFHAARQLLRSACGIPLDADPVEAGGRLRDAVARSAMHLAPWLPLLANIIGASVDRTEEVERLSPAFRAVRQRKAAVDFLLDNLGGPTVLVLDDIQWMDASSRELMDDFLAAADDEPLAVLTTRDGGQPLGEDVEGDRVEYPLTRLGDEDAHTLLGLVLGDHPRSGRDEEDLVRRSAGNPRYLIELARTAIEGGEAERLPESIEAAVTARIDLLSPDDRALLREAAVLGTTASLADLAALRDDPSVLAPDRWLSLAGFVHAQDDHLAFETPLYRAVAYEGLAFARRVDLHGRAADLLLARAADDAEIAHHCHHAGRHQDTWDHARRAARRAADDNAGPEAVTLLQLAFASADEAGLPAAAQIADAEVLADLAERIGEYTTAAKALDRWERGVPEQDAVVHARLARKRGWLAMRVGDLDAAAERYAAAEQGLGGRTDDDAVRERCEIALRRSSLASRRGDAAGCADAARQAQALAESLGDDRLLAECWYRLDLGWSELGDPRAAEVSDRALAAYEALGDLVGEANVRNNRGVWAYFSGDLDRAVEEWTRSRDARRRAGDVVGEATQDNNIGEILLDRGQIEEARALFTTARRTWRAARYAIGVAVASDNLGRCASAGGDLDEALRWLDDARERFEALGSKRWLATVTVHRAQALQLAERDDEAVETAQHAMALLLDLGPGVETLAAQARDVLASSGGSLRRP